MALYDFVEFSGAPPSKVEPASVVPKEFDIYYKDESQFLPEGKTFNELTPEEEQRLKSQYRFSPYKPGTYQGITAIGGMSKNV